MAGCRFWGSLLGALVSSAAGASLRAVPAALVDQARRTNLTAGCSVGGKPTAYKEAGCWKITKNIGQVNYEGSRLVSVSECWMYCQTKWKQGVQYFGVTGGDKCWCAHVHDGVKTSGKPCDQKCAGDDRKMCGGIDAANVYVMFDCTPPTKKEVAADKKAAKTKILKGYASFKGQTCGQGKGNKLKINGKVTMVGTPAQCKMACSKGSGSMQCHGFTYDQGATKCTFHMDVLDGNVKKAKTGSCYFKRLA